MCNCPAYQCIELPLAGCETTINLTDIVSDQTGTWRMELGFANAIYRVNISVIEGDAITIPNRFNENYTHTLKLFRANGDLVNDICYTIRTIPITLPNEGDVLVPPVTSGLVAHATPPITITAETAGATYTIAGARQDLGVSRGNMEEYGYTFAYDSIEDEGTWTFTSPTQEGEILKFKYNRLS